MKPKHTLQDKQKKLRELEKELSHILSKKKLDKDKLRKVQNRIRVQNYYIRNHNQNANKIYTETKTRENKSLKR